MESYLLLFTAFIVVALLALIRWYVMSQRRSESEPATINGATATEKLLMLEQLAVLATEKLRVMDETLDVLDGEVYESVRLNSHDTSVELDERCHDPLFRTAAKDQRDRQLRARNRLARLFGIDERRPHDWRPREY